MAASTTTTPPPPPPPCTVRGTHQFDIVGYSLIKSFPAGAYVRSGSFAVGGYRWSVRFYPGGFSAPHHRAHVSAFLKLTTRNARAWACYDLRVVDRRTGLSRSVRRAAVPVVFDYWGKNKAKRGARAFMPRAELEAAASSSSSSSPYQYLRDDRITIECVVDVVDEARVPEAVVLCRYRLRLPPSDLATHMGDLLLMLNRNQHAGGNHGQQLAEEDVVTLDVQGEVFRAHRVVLAARSPVFMAEMYGPMKEKGMERVAIDSVQPVVFRALLGFVYTDTLRIPGDLIDGDGDGDDGDDDYREMVRHLLEAADRFGVERLKRICESILCRSVDAATVETTLALADRHYCQELKDVCIQFMSLGLQG